MGRPANVYLRFSCFFLIAPEANFSAVYFQSMSRAHGKYAGAPFYVRKFTAPPGACYQRYAVLEYLVTRTWYLVYDSSLQI